MKVIIFVRVSTADQSVERQVEELNAFASAQKWTVNKIIREVGSGTTPVEKRLAIDELKRSTLDLKVDKVLVSEISRLGRTTSESLSIVDFLTNHKVSCYEYQRRLETLNVDLTVNPIAELIISVLASVAKLEKAQLITRIKSGMASASRNGIHLGRIKGSIKTNEQFLREQKAVVNSLRSEKLTIRKTAKLYHVSIMTVMKVKKLTAA